ncbi:MAG: DNA-methyltransferase [Methanosarcinales archaeon]
MEEVRDNSVQLIVTSPPYNVNIDYGLHNDNMALEEYLKDFLLPIWKECKRVLCKGGRIAVNVADVGRKPHIPLHVYITQQFLDLGLLMRGTIYWDKSVSAGVSTAWGSWRSASNPTLRDVGEYIIVFCKDSYRLESENERFSTISAEEFTEFTKSVWRIKAASAKREGHPAPFPEEIPYRLIQLYTFVGDTVLDPFLGSGTTLKVAMSLGRRSIGYEINENYSSIIENKIHNFQSNFRLYKNLLGK